MPPFNFLLVMPDPFVTSALVSAGSNLLGGLLGSLGQKSSNKAYLQGISDTNATNLAISRETNKQNLDLFNAQNRFTQNMWAKTNEYNSPLATRSRLIAAGVSPDQMANGGQASFVQSAVGSPSIAAKMEAPQPLPSDLQPLAQSIGGAANDFLNAQYLKEQIQGQRTQNYIQGINADFAYQDRLNQLHSDIERIRNMKLSNDEKEKYLSYYENELRDLQYMREQNMRLNDLNADNLIATGNKIRSDEALNYATIEQGLSRLNLMSEQQRIDWFNAQTNSNLTSAQIDKLGRESTLLSLEWQFNRDTLSDRTKLEKLKYEYEALNDAEKRVLLWSTINNAKIQDLMSKSWFRKGFNFIFGVDPQSLLNGLFNAR